jgi:prepilin-type N-terminal cleavage/methylation domain-containing protein
MLPIEIAPHANQHTHLSVDSRSDAGDVSSPIQPMLGSSHFPMTDSSPIEPVRKRRQAAFTLIELLMVIAVILILAGITFGISRGVQNAQARAQAKAELATLAQAIEQFKSRYGDYPWHQSGGSWGSGGVDDTNQMLLYALTGRLVLRQEPVPGNPGSTRMTAVKISDDLDDSKVAKNPKFIDPSRFYVQENGAGQPIALLDPWGNPYKYWYKWDDAPDQWEVFGYHLYSLGGDGEEDNSEIEQSPRTGVIKPTYRDADTNIDNIFVGE